MLHAFLGGGFPVPQQLLWQKKSQRSGKKNFFDLVNFFDWKTSLNTRKFSRIRPAKDNFRRESTNWRSRCPRSREILAEDFLKIFYFLFCLNKTLTILIKNFTNWDVTDVFQIVISIHGLRKLFIGQLALMVERIKAIFVPSGPAVPFHFFFEFMPGT